MNILFREVEHLRSEKDILRQKMKERAQRIDLLRFQILEIDEVKLQPGEKDTLTAERTIAVNLNSLKELSETAYAMIYGSEGSCMEKLSLIIGKAKELAAIDQSAAEILRMLEESRTVERRGKRRLSVRSYADADLKRKEDRTKER